MGVQGAAGVWVAPSTRCRTGVPDEGGNHHAVRAEVCRTGVPRHCRLSTARARALATPAKAPVAAAGAAARSLRRYRVCCCCRHRLGLQPKQQSPFVPTYRLGNLVAAAAWHLREGLPSQGAAASHRKEPQSSPLGLPTAPRPRMHASRGVNACKPRTRRHASRGVELSRRQLRPYGTRAPACFASAAERVGAAQGAKAGAAYVAVPREIVGAHRAAQEKPSALTWPHRRRRGVRSTRVREHRRWPAPPASLPPASQAEVAAPATDGAAGVSSHAPLVAPPNQPHRYRYWEAPQRHSRNR